MTRAQRRRNRFTHGKRKQETRKIVESRGKCVLSKARSCHGYCDLDCPAEYSGSRNDERAKLSFVEQLKDAKQVTHPAPAFSRVCALCGEIEIINGVECEAVDATFFDLGWRYDVFNGGYVCKVCSVPSGLMMQKRRA